jgi:hypothetical protein
MSVASGPGGRRGSQAGKNNLLLGWCYNCNLDSYLACNIPSYFNWVYGGTGPTHVLVVRGLNEQVLEENLHCEFSKHAPIKVMKFLTSVSEQGGD